MNALRARDLYHIATDRKGGYIAFEHERKYIAFAKANISPKKVFVLKKTVAVKKKRTECVTSLSALLLFSVFAVIFS